MLVPYGCVGRAWFAVERAVYLCVIWPHRFDRMRRHSVFLRLLIPQVPTRDIKQAELLKSHLS